MCESNGVAQHQRATQRNVSQVCDDDNQPCSSTKCKQPVRVVNKTIQKVKKQVRNKRKTKRDAKAFLKIDNKYEEMVQTIDYSINRKHNREDSKAVYFDWPLFQQITKEYCGYAARVDNDSLEHIPKLHMNFIVKLVKYALLSRDYRKLSVAILPVTFFPKETPEMFWKVGVELLKNSKSTRGGDRLWRFLHRMKLLMFHQRMPETYLHYAVTTLLQSCRQRGALLEMSALHQVYSNLSEKVSFKKFDQDPCYQLFYGIVLFTLWCNEYVTWKNTTNKRVVGSNYHDDEDSEDEEEEDEDEMEDRVQNRKYKGTNLMSLYSRQAVEIFNIATSRMGTWDLILPKLVRLVLHENGAVSACEVLQKHAENNGDNPIGYCYLIHWMKHIKTFEGQLVKAYENLARVDPTNDLVKDLCTIYKKQESYSKLLSVLLERLDHVVCCYSLPDWSMLWQVIKQRNNISEIDTFLKDFVKKRPRWLRDLEVVASTSSNNENKDKHSKVNEIKHHIVEAFRQVNDDTLTPKSQKREFKNGSIHFVSLLHESDGENLDQSNSIHLEDVSSPEPISDCQSTDDEMLISNSVPPFTETWDWTFSGSPTNFTGSIARKQTITKRLNRRRKVPNKEFTVSRKKTNEKTSNYTKRFYKPRKKKNNKSIRVISSESSSSNESLGDVSMDAKQRTRKSFDSSNNQVKTAIRDSAEPCTPNAKLSESPSLSCTPFTRHLLNNAHTPTSSSNAIYKLGSGNVSVIKFVSSSASESSNESSPPKPTKWKSRLSDEQDTISEEDKYEISNQNRNKFINSRLRPRNLGFSRCDKITKSNNKHLKSGRFKARKSKLRVDDEITSSCSSGCDMGGGCDTGGAVKESETIATKSRRALIRNTSLAIISTTHCSESYMDSSLIDNSNNSKKTRASSTKDGAKFERKNTSLAILSSTDCSGSNSDSSFIANSDISKEKDGVKLKRNNTSLAILSSTDCSESNSDSNLIVNSSVSKRKVCKLNKAHVESIVTPEVPKVILNDVFDKDDRSSKGDENRNYERIFVTKTSSRNKYTKNQDVIAVETLDESYTKDESPEFEFFTPCIRTIDYNKNVTKCNRESDLLPSNVPETPLKGIPIGDIQEFGPLMSHALIKQPTKSSNRKLIREKKQEFSAVRDTDIPSFSSSEDISTTEVTTKHKLEELFLSSNSESSIPVTNLTSIGMKRKRRPFETSNTPERSEFKRKRKSRFLL